MGGEPCIRDTRIPVWLLVSYNSQGLSDSDLLVQYPSLRAADLTAAWEYFAVNFESIHRQNARHRAA